MYSGLVDQVQRLEQLGFIWDFNEYKWNKMFEALEQYERDQDDCHVPAIWPQNQGLANWVSAQRAAKKRGQLDDDQARRLDKLGFVWTPPMGTRKGRK